MNKYLVFLTLILTPAFSVHAADTTTVKKCISNYNKDYCQDSYIPTWDTSTWSTSTTFAASCANPDNPLEKFVVKGFAIPTGNTINNKPSHESSGPADDNNKCAYCKFACLCIVTVPVLQIKATKRDNPSGYNGMTVSSFLLHKNCTQQCADLFTKTENTIDTIPSVTQKQDKICPDGYTAQITETLGKYSTQSCPDGTTTETRNLQSCMDGKSHTICHMYIPNNSEMSDTRGSFTINEGICPY